MREENFQVAKCLTSQSESSIVPINKSQSEDYSFSEQFVPDTTDFQPLSYNKAIKRTTNEITSKRHVNLAQTKSPPDWWRNMWEAIWRFFLKWFLIAILCLAILVGLIVGVYYLALWIGGPIAALITLVIILFVLQIAFDIDLSWILNLF